MALEPKAETEYLYLAPEVTRVEVPVEVDREVEVVREVPIKLSEFESVQELKDWLAKDDTDEVMRVARRIDSSLNCVDYADMLVERARGDGWDIYYQSVDKGYKRGDTLEAYPTAHGLCATRIGGIIYYIEPKDDGAWAARYVR